MSRISIGLFATASLLPLGWAGQCWDWSEVENRGWSCGGMYEKSCTCPTSKVQHECEHNGHKYYSCKDDDSPGAEPSGPFGKAKTKGCKCTQECNSKGWCYGDCFDWGWDNCVASDGSSNLDPEPTDKTLGQFMADFVLANDGKYVHSDLQSSASCWDLARRAMEEAAKAGYEFKHGRMYVWSNHVVQIENARPGDIAQFRGWSEKITEPNGAWHTLTAANPHTAVVVEKYDQANCALTTMDQNPQAVHQSIYHPCKKSSGQVTIYRIDDISSSRLYFTNVPEIFSMVSLSNLGLGAAVALSLTAIVGVVMKRRLAHPDECKEELMLEDPNEAE